MGKPSERPTKDGDCRSNHEEEKEKYFFKVMIGDFRERITVPDAFVKYFRGKLTRNIKLESRKGCTFDAQITSNHNELVLQSGWNTFASAHDLKLGDFLLFKYNGISQLEVLIFDPSGCEKVPSSLVINNTYIHGPEPIEISSSFDDIPINSQRSERPNKANQIVSISSSRSPPKPDASDYFSSSEDDLEAHSVPLYILPSGTRLTGVQTKKLEKRVQAIQSKTQIYGCILNTNSLYGKSPALYFSWKYSDIYLPFDNETLILERQGKNWEVRCCAASNKRKRLRRGWKQFARDNSLKVGDFCLFELLKKKREYTMRVHIIRKK